MELNKYSKTITQDPTQPAAQAQLYALGLTDDDLRKAQVGIVSMGYDGNPCNMHLNGLSQHVKYGDMAENESGVHTILDYPGGAIMPSMIALTDFQDTLKHILVRHEQGGIHAAQGYARTSGEVGVAFATSGPGATNLVTGLADAQIDSTPLTICPGETLFEIEEALEKGTIICYLLSDAAQIELWPTVQKNLTPATGIVPPKDVDVFLVAPKAQYSLRRLSYRQGISPILQEKEGLDGAIQGFLLCQYEGLRANGHSPSEQISDETVEELTQSLMPLVARKTYGLDVCNCSTTGTKEA
ncbi:hypothetical protein FQR65_LT16061 [Abscondita terminalis]|nr:hypothetical protein FQR65_LT16061 [Abscondita terminalis]